MRELQSTFGMVALLAIAWVISENRRAVSWRQAATGLAVTFATATLFLKVPEVTAVFFVLNNPVEAHALAPQARHSFVFGLVRGGALPLQLDDPRAQVH